MNTAPELEFEDAPAPPVVPAGVQGAADFYGVNRKSIGRWRDAGVEAGLPCPLREPCKMAEWYRQVISRPLPESVAAAIARVEAPAAPAKPATPPTVAPVRAPMANLVEESSLLERLKQNELALHERYRNALAQPDITDAELRRYREEWQESSDQVSLHVARAKKTGELVSPAEYEAAFSRFLEKLPEALRHSFPAEPPAGEWRTVVTDAIRAAFRRLPDTLTNLLSAA